VRKFLLIIIAALALCGCPKPQDSDEPPSLPPSDESEEYHDRLEEERHDWLDEDNKRDEPPLPT